MTDIAQTPIDSKSIKYIAKKYNPLSYRRELIQMLLQACPTVNFCDYEKLELHRIVNDVLMNNYNGEQALKYELFNLFKKKKLVAAFEIRIKNSRLDFLTINGCTSSFEIKSGLDNLNKLQKQASDYLSAFEYNYLIIDEKHLEKALGLIPTAFGLWSFKNGKKKIHRSAELNKQVDPEVQLSLLTKKELQIFFNEAEGDKQKTLRYFTSDDINLRFKSALKERYSERWSFLTQNISSILPIDLQFFFKTNIDPNFVYQ